jgi:hypothetical protein
MVNATVGKTGVAFTFTFKVILFQQAASINYEQNYKII